VWSARWTSTPAARAPAARLPRGPDAGRSSKIPSEARMSEQQVAYLRQCPGCGDRLTMLGDQLRCAVHGAFFAYGPRLLIGVPMATRLSPTLLPWETLEEAEARCAREHAGRMHHSDVGERDRLSLHEEHFYADS